jgi:cytochrome P450
LGLTKLPGEINLISSDGADWKWRRVHETDMFSGMSVRKLEPLIQEQVEVMLDVLDKKCNGETFDIDRFMCHCALDVIGTTAYGKSFNAMKGDTFCAELVNDNFKDGNSNFGLSAYSLI